MTGGKSHWERIYETKAANELSWHQSEPVTSLRLIGAAGISPAT